MVLHLKAPPTPAQTTAALADLPDGFAALGAHLLNAAGTTADTVLIAADALDAGARERSAILGRWDIEAQAMRRLAAILRDAAPRYPHPPRLPAGANDAAAAALGRRAQAAGLGTAGAWGDA